eukprot:5422473-Amphidinium_carterae.3
MVRSVRLARAHQLLLEVWDWVADGCGGCAVFSILFAWVSLAVALSALLEKAKRLAPVHTAVRLAAAQSANMHAHVHARGFPQYITATSTGQMSFFALKHLALCRGERWSEVKQSIQRIDKAPTEKRAAVQDRAWTSALFLFDGAGDKVRCCMVENVLGLSHDTLYMDLSAGIMVVVVTHPDGAADRTSLDGGRGLAH